MGMYMYIPHTVANFKFGEFGIPYAPVVASIYIAKFKLHQYQWRAV